MRSVLHTIILKFSVIVILTFKEFHHFSHVWNKITVFILQLATLCMLRFLQSDLQGVKSFKPFLKCMANYIRPCVHSIIIDTPCKFLWDWSQATKVKGVKHLLSYLFWSHKFYRNEKKIFNRYRKKIRAKWQRIKVLFTQIRDIGWGLGIRDRNPGSGKNLFQIQGWKRHRIPDSDPEHWLTVTSNK